MNVKNDVSGTSDGYVFTPGELALRFRIVVRGDLFAPHRVVEGVQVVQITHVAGDNVLWTNGLRSREGVKFTSISDRRELIPLSALENFEPLGSGDRSATVDSDCWRVLAPITADPIDRLDAVLTHSARDNRQSAGA